MVQELCHLITYVFIAGAEIKEKRNQNI